MNTIALRASERRIAEAILETHAPELCVWVFGSRATGRAHAHSDLDLLVSSEHRVGLCMYTALKYAFSESDLPFEVDILDVRSCSDEFLASIVPDAILLRGVAALGTGTSRRRGNPMGSSAV